MFFFKFYFQSEHLSNVCTLNKRFNIYNGLIICCIIVYEAINNSQTLFVSSVLYSNVLHFYFKITATKSYYVFDSG